MRWICCQLGAREHYAVPRALHRAGALRGLVTEAWCPPGSAPIDLSGAGLRRLAERHEPELDSATVSHFTARALGFELGERLRRRSGWASMMARNDWFQTQALKALARFEAPAGETVLFAYSHAAGRLLDYARSRGWHTVLGQIDPGIEEERLIAREVAAHPRWAVNWAPAPPDYWDAWRRECDLAERIVVNSGWSASLLARAGVDDGKVDVVPLVLEGAQSAAAPPRRYPAAFGRDRPLRVLFLGVLTPRKGLRAVLDAIELLRGDETVEFRFVGPQPDGGTLPLTSAPDARPRVIFEGAVPRSETGRFYAEADVFLFPTLSDGFGLTQLEARAWRLPTIASSHCGEVVTDDIDGLLLPSVDGMAIRDALVAVRDNPQRLQRFADAIAPRPEFTLSGLADALATLQFSS